MLNVNRFSYWISNDGISGRNPFTGQDGVTYPRGTGHVIFTDGFLWGGYVRDNDPTLPRLRVGGFTYFTSLQPGRIISPGNPQNPNDPEVRIYRIRKDYQTVSEAVLRRDIAELRYNGDSLQATAADVQDLRDSYARDWQEWPVDAGAPFYDLNHNGQYEPEQGETPGLANADQVIWFVCNDWRAPWNPFPSPNIGTELQVTMGTYQNKGALSNVIIQRYLLINKSGFRIDSLYIGKWSDFDIGDLKDDLAGSDSVLEMGYCYSGFPTDEVFQSINLYPPAAGYVVLQGPIVPSPGDTAYFNFKKRADYKNLKLTSVTYESPFVDLGPPVADYDFTLGLYNGLRGYLPTSDIAHPDPYLVGAGPNTGQPTFFPFSGDPVTTLGDVDGQGNNDGPTERQLTISTGPITMQPGDSQEVIYALVVGEGMEAYPYAVEALRLNTSMVRHEFPNFERALHTPPAPRVSATSFNNKVVLDWGKNAQLLQEIDREDLPGNYFFEGYNIYQLPTPNAPVEEAIRIKTIDRETPPRIIPGYKKDPVSGIYSYGPIVIGSNMGIQYFWEIEQDALTGKPFVDGETYHFAVSAYRYTPAPGVPFPVVESELGRVSVRVLNNNPGYSNLTGHEIPVTHQGKSAGEVSATVIDPAQLTGHTYQVSFDEQQHWTLTDLTSGEIKLTNQADHSGSRNIPTIDGVLVAVSGPDSTDLADWKLQGSYWISGNYWGGRYLYGGLDTGRRLWGSALNTNDLVPMQIEFQDENQVNQSGFIGQGAVYREDLGFQFDAIGELPLAAFDVLDPDQPRRTNVLFVENDSLAPANRLWDMGWDGNRFPDEIGAGERLFFMKSDYDPANPLYSSANLQADADQLDILYIIWPKERGSRSYLLAEFTMDILVDLVNTPDDYFFFTAPAAPAIPTVFRLESNFPNPFNTSTTLRFQLPGRSRVILDIYNLLGQHVARPLDAFRNEGSHQFRWDAGNLASGMYIYRLSTSFGSADGKMLLVK